MNTKKLVTLLVITTISTFYGYSQNTFDAQKVFEQNLKNALIQDAVNIVTGNEVTNDYQSVNEFLPGSGISGTMFLGNNTMTDFVGVNYIALNMEDQSPTINGKPAVWINGGYSWQCVPLSDVAMISYNSFEYISARNYRLSVSVSLKDGSSYDYIINPARNTIKILIKAGGSNAQEQLVQVFNPSQLLVKSLIFY
jgi:hypothetical protein